MFYPWWTIICLCRGGGHWDIRHKQVVAASSLPRLTMKWRVPYCNDGERREGRRVGGRERGTRDIQLSNREAKYCNLFRHNRLNRLQREEYSVLGAFHPPLLHTSSVMRRMDAQPRVGKKKKKRRRQEIQHLNSFWVYIERRRRGLAGIIDIQMKSLEWMKECPFFYFGHHKRHTCVLIQLSKLCLLCGSWWQQTRVLKEPHQCVLESCVSNLQLCISKQKNVYLQV